MQEIAALTGQAEAAIAAGDAAALARLMTRNLQLRRELFSDAALDPRSLRMAAMAESLGAGCNFAGSGGAVVVVCPGGEEQEEALRARVAKDPDLAIEQLVVRTARAGREPPPGV